MSSAPYRVESVAVIGLARSGEAVATLLRRDGAHVYASDSGDTPELRAAAARLRELGVEAELGNHDLSRIARADAVVVSPGVPPDAPAVRAARSAGVVVLSEVAVALDHLPGTRVIAVTGTNGKSTTTALVAHLLAELGREVVAAGNIGRALSETAVSNDAPQWIALELSSFQLHDTPGLRPLAGVLTNLSPDHLDRYDSVEAYYADKRRMFDGAGPDSIWVTNADDADVQRMTEGVPGHHYMFSLRGAADAWYDRPASRLMLLGREICTRSDLRLAGDHNVANALAAALAVAVTHRERPLEDVIAAVTRGFRSFSGLPHRLEVVAERNGVLWINDSKATNVESARVAVEAMDRPVVLLVGGRHKGDSYLPLLQKPGAVRKVLAFGEAGPIAARELKDAGADVDLLARDFREVVARAAECARPGDVVLLSPACSSYDMFRDFEQRGEAFRALVKEIVT